MKISKIFDVIVSLFGLFLLVPMWLFLLYSILVAIQPDRLVWFIFWAYVPLHFILSILGGIGKAIAEAME